MAVTTVPLPQPGSKRLVALLASLRPTWSRAAAYRALRATLVIPALFALTSQVLDNEQTALFATFGGFATLVLANFGGSRVDKLRAHLLLAVAGSVLILLGTVVSGTTAIAAVVTVAVAFCVLFVGIVGPNAVSGATAVLVAYVLPASSPGTLSMVPDRLAGWWMASAAGTIAVLLLAPRPEYRLRTSAAALARALADQLDAASLGADEDQAEGRSLATRQALLDAFAASPWRPSGLRTPDQALADLFEVLDWCTTLVDGAAHAEADLTALDEIDQRLLAHASGVLRDTAALLGGTGATPLLGELEQLATESAAGIAGFCRASEASPEVVHLSFYARLIAAAARSAAADALIVTRRAGADGVAAEQARWQGGAAGTVPAQRGLGRLGAIGRVVRDHAGVRSVWFLNSARGAVALAAAVTIADLLNVQHGFWVVLGALTVLRTNAASTGATALRAVAGTAVGFAVGAALIVGIGGDKTGLWVAFPLAVLVGSYAPGTAPFAVGQAAFTLMICVLYNILVPVGWRVGVVRVEDVALGVAVSSLASVLFWPRGASSVVAEDLAEAFHRGGLYLVQATAWALGLRTGPPDAGSGAVSAGIRLDDALRSFIAEQGTKRVPREKLWKLVGGAMQLRLTAQSLAEVSEPDTVQTSEARPLLEESVRLAGVCDDLAATVADLPATVAQELAKLPLDPSPPPGTLRGYSLWVSEHLDHLRGDLAQLGEVAGLVAKQRAQPWWR